MTSGTGTAGVSRPPDRKSQALRIGLLLSLLGSVLLFSCSPAPRAAPQPVSLYSTPAAEPWLSRLYECAGTSLLLTRVDRPDLAQIVLRVGEPELLDAPAYRIGTEEILVVTHRQSPVQNLTLQEARALFAGQGQVPVQVWVYPAGTDVQEVFEESVMAGRSVTASARLAVTPQQMSAALVNQADALGILPRHWKAGDVREVFTAASVPVLLIVQSEPQGPVREWIGCLQK